MYEMLGSLAGVGLFVWALLAFGKQERNRHHRKRLNWINEGRGSLRLASVGVSRDMAPLFESIDIAGAEITVVGGDGSYAVSARREPYKDMVFDWVKRGATVRYILTCADPQSLDSIKSIARVANMSGPGRIEVLIPSAGPMSSELADVLTRFKSEHPTLVKSRSVNALWHEGTHKNGSLYAFDVTFIVEGNGILSEDDKNLLSKATREVAQIMPVLQAA